MSCVLSCVQLLPDINSYLSVVIKTYFDDYINIAIF